MRTPASSLLLFTATLCLPLAASAAERLPDGVSRVGPAELKIDRQYIAPPGLERPTPQGPVDSNPPWLHVQIPLPSSKQAVREQKWHRRFYFKLSQDPAFKRDVIESGAKRWSFFNPYRKLAKGIWYWTYGVAPADSPNAPVWQKEVYAFTVDENAYAPEIPPTPEEALGAIRQLKSGPIAICRSEDIGNMLPEQTWPEGAARMRKDAAAALKKGELPIKVELTEKSIPAHLGKSPAKSFFMVKLRALFTAEERRVDALLRGYLLTGDERMKKLGTQRAIELENTRLNTVFDTPAGKIPLTGPAYYNTVPLLMLDAFWDDIPEGQRSAFVDLAIELMDKHGNGFPHLFDQLEHAHFNQHDWQGDIKNLLIGSAVLSRHRPAMEDWFAYAYELWLYRSPALSRADGGSMDGNGYLSVHDEPLTHLNWMLTRLTGYNYFRSKRWFTSFGTYMSYINPPGNPGAPFSDGGDTAPAVPFLTEMLAYLCPENPANVWRYKMMPKRDATDFSGDLVKGYRAMALLQLWRHHKAPDLSKATPPKDSAAAFRDVGMVGMHSDLFDPGKNLSLTFSSAVNGSFQHLHPAQNAFCVGYGGSPLFWRSGYYNGGQKHDAVSYKASRAHNTILVDGLMQGFDLGAYGWIPRFATGSRISYALGDASHAYNGMFPKYSVTDPDKPLPAGLTALGVPITRELGFGKPGVTRFRRHLVMLRPSHILIYDELEASKPVTWTFQLHSQQLMQQRGHATFITANGKGTASATLYSATPVMGSVTDQFFAAAVDEENKRGGQNPPHWHADISTRDKLPATRFLTIIQVQPGESVPAEPVFSSDGKSRWQIGDYQVTAELNPGRPSVLEVQDKSATCALSTGQATDGIALGAERRPAQAKGSTLLWEKIPGKTEVFTEAVDQLPPVLLYGNRY